MWNSLKYGLEIDIVYSINSFIYALRKLPVLKDLFTNDIYKNTTTKKVIGSFGIIISIFRNILLKYLYFFIIYYISIKAFSKTSKDTFIHMYFFLTIVGMFIHNQLLDPSKKKYFSIVLFNMDATSYFRAVLLWNQFKLLLWNSIFLFIFSSKLKIPIPITIQLIIFSFFIRLIGEALLIIFFKKNHYMWYSNTKYYFSVVITILLLALLPIINIYLSYIFISIGTIIATIFGIICFIYLIKIKDYKLMYKELTHMTNPMDSKNNDNYLKQSMVEVRNKDKYINSKKIEGKEGYDYLNTIFYERHKEILQRSAKRYSLILLIIYIILIYFIMNNLYPKTIDSFIKIHIQWLPIVMFFINRGAIMTQAMFYNCDHALLKYNFYREPKTLLGLFKKRLVTIIKVNLLPAIVIGIGNIIVYFLTNNKDLIIINILLVLSLNIFFSVHYLVIYYLLEPYNDNMEMKSIPYLIISIVTYFLSYSITKITITPTILAIIVLVFTIIYIPLSLLLVYKYSPATFKIK